MEYALKRQNFNSTVKTGEKVISMEHSGSESVKQTVEQVKEQDASLAAKSAERKKKLAAELNFQNYKVDLSALEKWMAEKKEYLDSALPSDSVDSVESELNVLDSHDVEFGAHGKQFDAVIKRGEKAIEDAHPSHAEVHSQLTKLKEDRAALEAAAAKRRSDLEKEHTYQTYKVKHAEVTAWLAEKQAFIAAESNITSVASAEVGIFIFLFFHSRLFFLFPLFPFLFFPFF